MNNFHIGLPGNLLNALETLFRVDLQIEPGVSRLIPRSVWQGRYRDFINGRSSPNQEHPTPDGEDSISVDDLLEDGPVAVTITDLMGRPDHCFMKARPLPYAGERIRRLTQIFEGHPLTLHLTITSQYDYFREESNRGDWAHLGQRIRSVPSWSELTERIRDAAQGVQVRVWDFEQPRKIALPFVLDMFNVREEESIYRLERSLSRIFPKNAITTNQPSVTELNGDLIESFDEQYARDLLEITSMSSVSLVSPENITQEYFLFD